MIVRSAVTPSSCSERVEHAARPYCLHLFTSNRVNVGFYHAVLAAVTIECIATCITHSQLRHCHSALTLWLVTHSHVCENIYFSTSPISFLLHAEPDWAVRTDIQHAQLEFKVCRARYLVTHIPRLYTALRENHSKGCSIISCRLAIAFNMLCS